MPKGCCNDGNCSCKITTTGRMDVSGSGQASDPYVLSIEAAISGQDNSTFDTDITGNGALDNPWLVETSYAPTARLNDVPDVNVPGPTNGQVLSWNAATSTWVASAPTTAAAGAVQHDGTMVGDGSVGVPLSVVPIESRMLGSFVNGVGLTDQGLNSVVQHFPTAADRTAAIGVAAANMLTMLDTNPGVIDYWNGSAWVPLVSQTKFVISGQLLTLSAAYTSGPVTVLSTQVSTTTDVNGVFDVLSATDLAGFSGVLSAQVQEIGTGTPWRAQVYPNVTKVSATAYRLDTGAVYAGVPVTATVIALLY
jgi:hypothetical protein